MNTLSFIIILIMAVFNGAGFIASISYNNPDEYSKFLLYFFLPVAIGCIMMLFKKRIGFIIAIVALLIMFLGAYTRDGATEEPFAIQILLLLVSIYLQKNGVSLWKQMK